MNQLSNEAAWSLILQRLKFRFFLEKELNLVDLKILIWAAKKNGMEIGGTVVACIADLAFKYAGEITNSAIPFSYGLKKLLIATYSLRILI